MDNLSVGLDQWNEVRWLQELHDIAVIPCPSPGDDLPASIFTLCAHILDKAPDRLEHASTKLRELQEAWAAAMQHLCGPKGVAWALGSMQDRNKEAKKQLNSEEMQMLIARYSKLVRTATWAHYNHDKLKAFQKDVGPFPAVFLEQCIAQVGHCSMLKDKLSLHAQKWVRSLHPPPPPPGILVCTLVATTTYLHTHEYTSSKGHKEGMPLILPALPSSHHHTSWPHLLQSQEEREDALVQSLLLVSHEPTTASSFHSGLSTICGTAALLSNGVFRYRGDKYRTCICSLGVV